MVAMHARLTLSKQLQHKMPKLVVTAALEPCSPGSRVKQLQHQDGMTQDIGNANQNTKTTRTRTRNLLYLIKFYRFIK